MQGFCHYPIDMHACDTCAGVSRSMHMCAGVHVHMCESVRKN